ncbi:hypothetical protein UPYG_G00060180 [Umbra pygmaea]|uniref:Ig-like domain-containing protein n=1 Tax=Umbra pygmaea TaxID=75934 RepID=A0ABD0X969_UMBPY
MSLRSTGSVLVVFLWSVTGVQVQHNVKICALKGSSVDLPCPIIYPTWAPVTEKVWYITELGGEPYDLRWDPKYEGRVKYLEENDCSLRITDLRETDEETYQFRYKTNSGWIDGSYRYTLTLTELKVQVSETQSNTLTCSTTCDLTDKTTYYIWYKNGIHLNPRTSSMNSNTVYIQDAGSYYCAVESSLGFPFTCSFSYSKYEGRVSYNKKPEKQQHTLTITGLTERDSDEYIFRLLTETDGKFKGIPGVILTVTGVFLEMDTTSVSEGRRVTLLCRTTCTLDHIPEYTWYKNGKPITNPVSSYNRLILDPVTSSDGGRYSCAVKGLDDLHSPEKSLTVRYVPRTRVSVSPSGEIVEGSSVTLTCSSDANPPVDKYTWYKKTVGGSQSNLFYNTGPHHVFNQVQSSDTADYYCTSSNEEGTSTSESVHVNVKYKPKYTSVSVSPSGEIVEGSSVTLTCSSDANPPVNKYTWYKKTVTSPKASGQSYSITNIRSEDSGEYYCEAQNKYGHLNSSTVFVDVQYGPRTPSVSVSPSGEIVEGSSVTLTCSSDANPPVYKYTWYKKNVASPKASGQSYSITNIRSEDSGEYYCEAENKYGHLNSSTVSVDVHYGPKNTSVSVSPSGEIVEGSSVTLTCSSDANPPVDKYTWYKKNVTSLKASGQSYIITNIRYEDTGEYYCEAHSKIASKKSDSMMLTVAERQTTVMTAFVGVTLFLLVLICFSGFMCFRWKKSSKSTSDTITRDTADYGQLFIQGDSSPVYVNISSMEMTSTAAQTANTDNQEDFHYASIHFSSSKNQEVPLYCTIQQSQAQKQVEEVQYAAVKFICPSAAPR